MLYWVLCVCVIESFVLISTTASLNYVIIFFIIFGVVCYTFLYKQIFVNFWELKLQINFSLKLTMIYLLNRYYVIRCFFLKNFNIIFYSNKVIYYFCIEFFDTINHLVKMSFMQIIKFFFVSLECYLVEGTFLKKNTLFFNINIIECNL